MSWDRIRGQDPARRTFQSAYELGRMGQSYMLVGPAGVGKLLFARELSKALLCEDPPGKLEACDRCRSCKQLEASTHPDLLTLSTPEGKQELPVETMREFCAHLAIKPVRGRYKIGIVVDADDFNEESSNTFLKTLEEPPPGVLLLVIATDTGRQLPTILSRCQVVRFNPLAANDIAAILEGHGVQDAAKRSRLAGIAQGSAGRAIALKDEAIWEVRAKLIDGLTSPRPDFRRLAEIWTTYFEDVPKLAGKEGKNTALQRDRVTLVLQFLIEAVQHALKISLGARTTEIENNEYARLQAFATRLGTDALMELLDRCVEASTYVERRVQLMLVVESVLEKFVAHRAT